MVWHHGADEHHQDVRRSWFGAIALLTMTTWAEAGPVTYRPLWSSGRYRCDGVERTIRWRNDAFTRIHEWQVFFGGEDGFKGDVLMYIINGKGDQVQDFNYHNGPRYAGDVVKHPLGYGAGNYLAATPDEVFTFYYTCSTGGLGHFSVSVIGS